MATPVVITGQVNEFVLVTNSAKNLDRNTINQILQSTPGGNTLGISPDAPGFHEYDVRTGICIVTNPNCTIENVFEALKRYPAPGATGESVYDGATTNVMLGPFPIGPVVHYIDPDGHSVTNVTTNEHTFYPGMVFRQVYQDGDLIAVQSLGFGNGPLGEWNKAFAETLWGGYQAVEIQHYIEGLTGANPLFVPTNYTPSSGSTEFQFAMYNDGSRAISEDNGAVQHVSSSSANGTKTDKYIDTAGIQPWSSETWTTEINGYLESHQQLLDAGNKIVEEFDTKNARVWDERVTGMDATGKVTNVQVKLNGENQTRSAASSVDFSAIGQVFGSAIGRAIAGNSNQFVQLAAGTVAGFVGQKFVQALINGPDAIDLAKLDIGDIFNGQGVSLAGAGLGAASSFLTAELATSIGLTGVGAQMFNAAVGGYLGSVLNQVRQQGFAVLTTGIDWNAALTGSEINISSALGSFLAHQFVHPESQFGAVGGQLAGAIGSALAYSFSVGLSTALNVFLPGVGAFFGTIIGTIIGDAIAGDPGYPKAFHDIEILASDPNHFQNRLFGVDDNGNAAVSKEMGDQVTKIANSYLDAVHGAAIAYSGKVMTGYNAGAAPYQYITGWFPNGTDPAPHFASASDAIQQGVRELLRNTEVFGGDLLVKRAHQAFMNGPHATPTETASDFTDLAGLGGDIRTAQDYQQYLNDRETINALIELYPNSAFTAGWAATFARVHELGLDQARASDFLGGLVGWLDSVAKAGLGAEAANATVRRDAGNSVIVEIKIANGAEIPGALSVFADRLVVSSDSSGQTLRFTVDSGLNASGTPYIGGGGIFTGTAGHDILVGGAGNDVILGGAGFDFIEGGAGSDYLFGQDGNDILRAGPGTDYLFGGAGDDTYVFNRGDGAVSVLDDYTLTADTSHWKDEWRDDDGDGTNEFHHDWIPETTTVHSDAGKDSLVFGPGIARSDIALVQSGNDLIVYVKSGVPGSDTVTLQHWFDDPKDRVEKFVFADGATLNLSSGVLAPYLVPFGEALSGSSVVEKSAVGTVVGTVTGFDFAGANLSYSLIDGAGGRFAINAATGVLTVAGAINYNDAASWQIVARVSDGAHVFDKAFTIDVIDIPNRAPVLSVPAGTIKADPGQALQVASWFSASDSDNDALNYFFQDGTTGSRRVGKGALAPCPPSSFPHARMEWWARRRALRARRLCPPYDFHALDSRRRHRLRAVGPPFPSDAARSRKLSGTAGRASSSPDGCR